MLNKFTFFLSFLSILFFNLIFPNSADAISDPLKRENSFYGIHILSPDEIDKSVELVNTNGGDWGYVTIPIQSDDKDIEKWQKFMNKAYELHIIPIIRLATGSFYKESSVWRKPTESDILDFANFLNSLYWPIKNKYVILFNEVNRFDEWGGDEPNPKEYADLVDYAVKVFKSKNQDFFLIFAGLDNAAPNLKGKYMDNFAFFSEVKKSNPDIFEKIDGIASHSYPNPNFSDAPNNYKITGISTYKFEKEMIDLFSNSKKPIFITETGWDSVNLGERKVSEYYSKAFNEIWAKDKDRIVAITPFLLESQNGQFDKFSFIKNSSLTEFGKVIQKIPKVKGNPEINIPPPLLKEEKYSLRVIDFKGKKIDGFKEMKIDGVLKTYLKAIFGV